MKFFFAPHNSNFNRKAFLKSGKNNGRVEQKNLSKIELNLFSFFALFSNSFV
jgi:hypothetical protein